MTSPIIPITCVQHAQDGRTRLVHSRELNDGHALGRLSPADEGITWIRGHHSETSPEGRALLAAYALGAPRSDEWIDVTFVRLDTNGEHAELGYIRARAPLFHAAEEGTLWIRGRHTVESAEGRALLDAFARVRDQYEGRFGMRR